MQLSKKQKKFCCNFIAFFESTLNLEHLGKNESHSLSISEVIDSERRDYLNAQKVLFLETLRQSTC